jgi:enterochelin esterase-like enzyme
MRTHGRLVATLLSLIFTFYSAAQEKPCQSTLTGHLDIIPLDSLVFQNHRNLRVWLPPGYADPANAQKKYPVLYLLDGDSAFDSCTAFAHDELHADETLTSLITSGKIPPVIAVGIDNGSDVIGHSPDGQNIDNGAGRTREYLPYPDTFLSPAVKEVLGNRLPDFLEQEVMPTISSKYRILTGSQNSALWGDSYAGAAALYIAIRRPDLFDRLIIESPSLQVGNGQLLRDSVSLTQLPKRIALGIGTAEVTPDQFPNADALNATWVRLIHVLADNLKAAAYAPPQLQLTIAERAHHATGEFGKRLAAGLLFIYAPEPVK